MTAEIAVMNRIAIALAADSAATSVQGKVAKIYNTADKLFQLVNGEPVGVMLYGGASFLTIPWETVIKVFRDSFSGRRDSLKAYADEFLAFLTSPQLINADFVDEDFFGTCGLVLNRLFLDARKEARKFQIDLKPALQAVAEALVTTWSAAAFLGPMDDSTLKGLRDRYSSQLNEQIDEELKPIAPIERELKELIINVLLLYAAKDVAWREQSTGIVIAGFGTKDLFPTLVQYSIDGVVYPNILRVLSEDTTNVSIETKSQIVPFAQDEMVHSFMTGVDPKFRTNIQQVFGNLLAKFSSLVSSELSGTLTPDELAKLETESKRAIDTVVQEFETELGRYSWKYHINPVMGAVTLLPKDQLAIMAETLVALTSFKRRMSKDQETVGGEIDVAVISKGDGFVWIKRKHYFDASLNPRYFERLRNKT